MSAVARKEHNLFVAAYIWFIAGVLFIRYSGVGKIVTALYIITQVITTVGYGDEVEMNTNAQKIFMSIYVLFGIAVVAEVISIIGQKAHERMQEQQMENLQKAINADEKKASQPTISPELQGLIQASTILLAMIGFGTVFYGSYESCTCGYGKMNSAGYGLVEGCKQNDCAATGGFVKTFVDSLYMSCITLTSVGFGDQTPLTQVGRFVSIFWMLGGVLAVGNQSGTHDPVGEVYGICR